ncbi:hypothetical protein ACIGEZ_13145 [Streptomyces sp. NPDC085481]|uniref:hypothetical protein n=1 Tax=Streptomyces sp. NPDC085481 TaxID=3365727 RepID=UPI0037D1EE71
MTSTMNKRELPARVSTTLDLGNDHAVQLLDFPSGERGVVEGGRAIEHQPAVPSKEEAPPDAGTYSVGEREAGYEESASVRTTDEQIWFKNTFCNGSQVCVQGWDWAICSTAWAVGSGTGFAMVGAEGTRNATFFLDVWQCICVGPFCLGGTQCFWVEKWRGLVVPGHWVSVALQPDHKYLQWRLEGAGGDTQVSLAAHYN